MVGGWSDRAHTLRSARYILFYEHQTAVRVDRVLGQVCGHIPQYGVRPIQLREVSRAVHGQGVRFDHVFRHSFRAVFVLPRGMPCDRHEHLVVRFVERDRRGDLNGARACGLAYRHTSVRERRQLISDSDTIKNDGFYGEFYRDKKQGSYLLLILAFLLRFCYNDFTINSNL